MKKTLVSSATLFFCLLAVLAVPALAVAATGSSPGSSVGQPMQGSSPGSSVDSPAPSPTYPSTGLINPLSAGTDLKELLADIIALVVKIGTVVIVLMLVYIGFLFATTSINPENKSKAREALLWTLVGALILLGAQAIAVGIQETVNALSTGS